MLKPKDKAALAMPDTKVVQTEMTPELREKWMRVSLKVMKLLQEETKNPLEAYSVLRFIIASMEDTYDIRGFVSVNKDDGAPA